VQSPTESWMLRASQPNAVSDRKQAAIDEEDYDAAKAIKAEIAKVSAGGVPSSGSEVSVRVDARGSGGEPAFTPESDPNPSPMPAGERLLETAVVFYIACSATCTLQVQLFLTEQNLSILGVD